MAKQRSEPVRVKISKTTVESLPIGGRIVDSAIDGFLARRLPSGVITYGYRYRPRGRPQQWVSLGVHGRNMTAEAARRQAKIYAGKVEQGKDPLAEERAEKAEEIQRQQTKRNTVNAILDRFIKEYVHEKELRSAKAIERSFEMHVRPAIGAIPIRDLTRDDINPMLRAIAKKTGPVARDRALSHLRKALNWYQIEDSKFTNPIVRGMGGNATKERERTLEDDEIRSLWTALQSPEIPNTFPDLVRVLLFTGQRRSDVAQMHRREIDGTDWTIPAGRYKNQGNHYVHLTAKTLEILPATKGFVFGARTGGERPYSGFSKGKAALDKIIAEQRKAAGLDPMPHWTLHDLRRTARTLMSRAGVLPDIAEITVGHRLQGVRRVYDRYTYAEQRKDALERLASLLDSIINPRAGNVVQFSKAEAQ